MLIDEWMDKRWRYCHHKKKGDIINPKVLTMKHVCDD